jgi:hypothetical protein
VVGSQNEALSVLTTDNRLFLLTTGCSLSLAAADALFLRLAFFFKAAEVAGELLLKEFDLVELAGGDGFGELVLEEDFALGGLGAIEGVDFGDLSLLLLGEFDGGGLLLEALHGEVVSGFHFVMREG